MALTKRRLGRGKVRVTFTMPALAGVTSLALVGDFNNWSITQDLLQPAADGSWSTAVTLAEGRTYQYRYFANGQAWHNDWQADAYVPNEYGSDNCLVSTQADALPVPKAAAKRAAKKSAA
ncbi:MAG: isoamylase early set domain-containing protein [Anaerolineales bacterium]|nr:isoamylase early set domain-containing protein [Anaerolineales bacterium]